jgi:hypothetical protein
VSQLPKRKAQGVVVVDGVKLRWCVHREPQWCTADGWKGLSIAVCLANGKGRELILEYPVSRRKTLRVMPAMVPSVTDRVWDMKWT